MHNHRGHGIGKTWNLILTFSRRENTGNFALTGGQFWRRRENILYYLVQKPVAFCKFKKKASLCKHYIILTHEFLYNIGNKS